MTVGTINNWTDLGVTGCVDVAALTVGGLPVVGSDGTVVLSAVAPAAADTWVRASLATWP